MTVFVRTYQTLGDPEPEERFFARAIAEERSRGGMRREGFSVCFYAETEQAASDKAHAWIAAERERQERIVNNRAAGAEKRRTAA